MHADKSKSPNRIARFAVCVYLNRARLMPFILVLNPSLDSDASTNQFQPQIHADAEQERVGAPLKYLRSSAFIGGCWT